MISMEGERTELIEDGRVSDEQVLLYIWTVVGRFRERGEGNSIECILCEEKLIHLAFAVLERQPVKLGF